MSVWPSTKASVVFRTLIKIGWQVKRHKASSHMVLEHTDHGLYVWAFHNNEEIGPKMLARIAKKTGLTPSDL